MPAAADASSRLSNAFSLLAATATWLLTGPPGQAGPVPSSVPGGRFTASTMMWWVAAKFPGST
jgi:hypothetical protein